MSGRKVGFVYSDEFLTHVTPPGHPERADRLRALTKHLKEAEVWDTLVHMSPVPATEDQILMVHSREYLDYVRNTCKDGGGLLDEGDTHAVSSSYQAALLAVGAALQAVDAVVGGKIHATFCAVRPPGHHAEFDRAMGFCLFNNVAVAARYCQRIHGMGRIAILDWDVHHGNGTQHTFEADPTVLFMSLHQYPFYPGTGARRERGVGKGEGYTLNIPLPAGSGEGRYMQAFTEEIVPTLDRFAPNMLIISAGFDAHKDDPLAGMNLREDSYAAMTSLVGDIAPIVSVLEGGYNLVALARSVECHLRALGKS